MIKQKNGCNPHTKPAIVDEKFIRESILTRTAKIIKGYNEEVPSFVGILSELDIESITLYIKSLGKK